jgi:hypothetical protein
MRVQQQLSQKLSSISTRAAVAGVLVSAAACATSPASTASAGPHLSEARSSSATLTAADFARVPAASTAFEAVRQLRPLFLRPRPGGVVARNQQPVLAVYINGMYAGSADVLLTIPTSTVQKMRYLQRTEAMTFAGSQTRGDGFIMVDLKGFDRRAAR